MVMRYPKKGFFSILFTCPAFALSLLASPALEDLEGQWMAGVFLVQGEHRTFGDIERLSFDNQGQMQIQRNVPPVQLLEKSDGQLVLTQTILQSTPNAALKWMEEPKGIKGFLLSSTFEWMEGESVTTESYFYHLPPFNNIPANWVGRWINESHESSNRFLSESLRIDQSGNFGGTSGGRLNWSIHPVAPDHLIFFKNSQAALMRYEWQEPYLALTILRWFGEERDQPERSSIILKSLDDGEGERERIRQNLLWLRNATRQFLLEYGREKVDINDLLKDYRGLIEESFLPGPERYGIIRNGNESPELFQSNKDGRFPADSFYLREDMEYLHAEGDFPDSPLRIKF